MYTFIHFRHPRPGSCQFLIPSLEIDDTIGIMAHGSQSSNIFKQETPNSPNNIGGFHTRWYPQMGGLQWKILWKWMITFIWPRASQENPCPKTSSEHTVGKDHCIGLAPADVVPFFWRRVQQIWSASEASSGANFQIGLRRVEHTNIKYKTMVKYVYASNSFHESQWNYECN